MHELSAGAACLALISAAFLVAHGQDHSDERPSEGSIRFIMDNANFQPPKYTLVINENGQGHYRSELGTAVQRDPKAPAPHSQDRDILVSHALREHIFQVARSNKFFAIRCVVAPSSPFQAKGTFDYEGPDGTGHCDFGSGSAPQIGDLADTMQAIAATLEEGARLESQYMHARLALDPELERFLEDVRSNQATELENIKPILERIANDNAILHRAQRSAKELLALVPAD
jgi:hypothetical protein